MPVASWQLIWESARLAKKSFGRYHDFVFGDGTEGAERYSDSSIDVLLADPPYDISAVYGCESQAPRCLRKDVWSFNYAQGSFWRLGQTIPAAS